MLTKRSSTALMRVPVCGPKILSHLRGRRSVAHCPFLEYRKFIPPFWVRELEQSNVGTTQAQPRLSSIWFDGPL